MRISDWSSDVCSSDLDSAARLRQGLADVLRLGIDSDLLLELASALGLCMGEPFLLHVLDNDVRLEDFVQRVGPSCVHLLLRLELGQRPLRFNKPLRAPRPELVLTLRTSDFPPWGALSPGAPHPDWKT